MVEKASRVRIYLLVKSALSIEVPFKQSSDQYYVLPSNFRG